ncbi:TolC family protein [Singulisphaera rosea]
MPAQDEHGRGWIVRRLCWLLAAGILLPALVGCTRRYYRDFADRDVYRIEKERMDDWRWQVPDRPVEADPRSRIGDVHDPNHEPIPPDDPGARPFQVTAGRPFEFHGWKKRGVAAVEDMNWLKCIPRGKDGTVELSGPSAMQIALMNNRQYQTNVEQVYLQALSLTLTRFTFFPQLFGNQTTQYRRFGANKNESNQLQLLTQDSLNWTFYSGAQLLVNFANTLVFEYTGKGFQTVNSGLTVSLTQPLLQGAWARNFTQPLSLAERETLYTVRTFAHYRRQFYVDTITGYLDLLLSLQQIRNQQNQVDGFKRNLDINDAFVRAGLVTPLQRDFIALSYQQSLSSLLGQEASYQTALDAYRVTQLGLPADFPMTLDEEMLKGFELNDPGLDVMRAESEKLYLSLLQYDEPPSKSFMGDTAQRLLKDIEELKGVGQGVGKELDQWLAQIKAEKGKVGTGPGPTEQDERESLDRQIELSKSLVDAYAATRFDLEEDVRDIKEYLETLDKTDLNEAWRTLHDVFISREFRSRLTELLVIQTQIRVYLIEVKPVDLTVEKAIETALANRLDLMNSLGAVTDTWRNVEAAGNQLLAGLNVFYNAQINSDPNHLGLLRFDAHDTQQFTGFEFAAPIVRRTQRNTYRADQILYQQARRAYMLNHDEIVQTIRLDMRSLNLNRRQFEINRVALLIAARQVDQAENNARSSTGADSGAGQTSGLNVINAQQSLLQAKNQLIGNWIQYEESRLTLFKDFDVMNIDVQGVWTNDDSIPTFNGGSVPATPDPVGAPRENLLPPPAPATRSPFATP